MAEFCNKCSKEMGFKTPDIDVVKLFEDLLPESYFPVLCEGCGMLGVGMDKDGQLMLIFNIETQEGDDYIIEEETTGWIKSDINEYKN